MLGFRMKINESSNDVKSRSIGRYEMLIGLMLCLFPLWGGASEKAHYVERNYAMAADAPAKQTPAQAQLKSEGCLSCHSKTDQPSMHTNPGVNLGCTDCHGGDATVTSTSRNKEDPNYRKFLEAAHILPSYPDQWHFPSSANPAGSFALLNKENRSFVRFVNPSDYRVARESCGACHMKEIEAAERSLMSTSAMLWGGAAYNNGILPFKNYILGESYDENGDPAMLFNPVTPSDIMKDAGILPSLAPLPSWETVPPADVFRVFESGGRNISNLFPEVGNPNILPSLNRLEEPGRPDIKQSNRGKGTGSRVAIPVLNMTKTRLNDPHAWFMGTNDNPGDYRASGCAACHVVYGNDRQKEHSGPYAAKGHQGFSDSIDPTIPKQESGHPLKHQFTRAIPSSQCMVCHMHQPNVFVNTFYGYTMWDYESDAPTMWPEKQRYPSDEEMREISLRNPEGAAARGKWSDPEFLKDVFNLNEKLNDTQFADYHGHGWNFRAAFKRDRDGTLLDDTGTPVSDMDPKKFQKAVHLSSIHMDKGMHCVDCHFSKDNHGNGHIYGEVAAAIEVDCADCHGTADEYPDLKTSGPAAPVKGTDLSLLRTQDGRLRFEWRGKKLYQRSALNDDLEWQVSLVKNSLNPKHKEYNAKAARAKTVSEKNHESWGTQVAPEDWAHKNEDMTCFACHTSWTTSCGGCHLPIEANWKTERLHYEGGETRNYATYNPQVVRDQMFMLGKHGSVKEGRIAPVRSSSALVLSSTNANREKIYIQQPPISASGFSSQAFAPHFPHTVRKSETKTCDDCHVSEDNDNNAIMAQLLLQGTQFINFIGFNAWVGGSDDVSAVQVTEWDEPQAVIGSYLHRYAYPDWFEDHQNNKQELQTSHSHDANQVQCLQLRGEYLYTSQGKKGVRVYDVASIANKGVSQRIIEGPFSPLGHDTHVATQDAACVTLPTNQPINPVLNQGKLMREDNQEQPFHPLYHYAYVADREEGLILINVDTLADGNARNNQLKRALTWNPDGLLNGAQHITVGGYYLYITVDAGLAVVNIDDPLKPKIEGVVTLKGAHSSFLQFRYLFVTDAEGLKVIDVTHPQKPKLVKDAFLAMDNARRLFVSRTYAYIAAEGQGIAIVDVERPEQPKLVQYFDADGQLNDAQDIVVATTNASLFAYVADGKNGLKVVQLTSPELQPKFYGFSPKPNPQLVAQHRTKSAALALSKGLERDRAVDETGGQIAVTGRLGSRPFNAEEMKKLYLKKNGEVWKVSK